MLQGPDIDLVNPLVPEAQYGERTFSLHITYRECQFTATLQIFRVTLPFFLDCRRPLYVLGRGLPLMVAQSLIQCTVRHLGRTMMHSATLAKFGALAQFLKSKNVGWKIFFFNLSNELRTVRHCATIMLAVLQSRFFYVKILYLLWELLNIVFKTVAEESKACVQEDC